MTHQDNDDAIDVIDALRSELRRVPLSPEFSARLRQRIEAEPDVRGAAWLSGWRWLVPVASVAAVVIAAVSLSRLGMETPIPLVARAPMATPTPVEIEPEHPSTSAVAKAPADKRAPKNRSLEVITNQPAILRAVWGRVGKGAPMVEVSTTLVPDTVPEIVVPPVQVSPIVVKPLGDLRLVPGALPIIR